LLDIHKNEIKSYIILDKIERLIREIRKNKEDDDEEFIRYSEEVILHEYYI
jgi:hypothetical protein